MNIYRLHQHMEVVLKALDTGQDLIKFIFILARGYRQIVESLTGVVYEPNRTAFSRQQLEAQERFQEFRRHAERFSIGSIFHEIIQFKSALATIVEEGHGEAESLLVHLPRDVDDFFEALEQFVKTGKDDAFTALMAEAHNLYPVLITARRAFQAIEDLSREDEAEVTDETLYALTLRSETPCPFRVRVRKLTAIERGYDTLMGLLDEDPEVYPLHVLRMETEGQELCLQGHRAALSLFSALLQRFSLFLYHRCSLPSTTSIPERVIATQSLINLADELELAGLTAPLGDERRLKQAALHLLQAFVILLAGDPVLHVDGRRLAVEDGAEERYIRLSNELLASRPEPALAAA